MPQKPNGAVHELPLLVHQMKGESQPFLNDVQRQALDAALAAKLSKLSCKFVFICLRGSKRTAALLVEAPCLQRVQRMQSPGCHIEKVWNGQCPVCSCATL